MKTEYDIKDKVWIHIGERKLSEGRVVEIIDLEHLGEGHDPKHELYVIELKTGIEDIYEVRTFEQISPDAKGPINLFRKTKTRLEQRALKRLGMIIPNEDSVIPADGYVPEPAVDMFEPDYSEEDEPTPEQIHAAMEASQAASAYPKTIINQPAPKKKRYNNRGNTAKRKPRTTAV
jgi:hypothetical protein